VKILQSLYTPMIPRSELWSSFIPQQVAVGTDDTSWGVAGWHRLMSPV
jgi:hypothetical protein